MAEPARYPLKRRLRDARREHLAEQYPGDLATELDLHRKGGVLYRWRPVLAMCAAVALAGGAFWVSAVLGASQTPPPLQHAEADPAQARHPQADPDAADPPAPYLFADLAPADYAKARDKLADTTARAKQHASSYWSERWAGQTTPAPPSFGTPGMTMSPGSIPALRLPPLTLPRGARLPAATLPTLRKEMS